MLITSKVRPILRSLLTRSNCVRYVSTVKITEQKVKVGKYDINYVNSFIKDSKLEKALICLPGALGSAATDFKNQIENLPKLLPNHNVIAWDPPGYGKSIPPEKKFSKDFLEKDADIVKQLMQVLGFNKFDVLGWSDGGITGLILAGKYPQHVGKLAIFGSNAYIVDEDIKIYDGIRDVSKWSERMRKPLEELYGAEYFKNKWEEWVDTFKLIHKENNGDLCSKYLKNIQADTLILHGEKDPMLAKEHVPYLMQNIPRAKLITWPEGKHNIHLKYAEDFNKKVSEFMKK